MADDWDADEFEPPPVVAPPAAASATAKDASTFDDEEEEEEKPTAAVPKSMPKKEKKKIGEGKGESSVKDETLADPIAEKLRRQKLVEDSDFKHAEELFSDTRNPDDLSPSTLAEMEDYGRLVAAKLLNKHQERPFYPSMIRTLLKAALATSSSADVKDIETAVVTLRNERLKAEKDRDGKSKKSANKKRFLNAGSGGGAGGDMEDARFYAQSLDTPGAADEYEFM